MQEEKLFIKKKIRGTTIDIGNERTGTNNLNSLTWVLEHFNHGDKK